MLRIEAERKRRGMTQRDVANLAGVYPGDVSRLENGDAETCPGHLDRVAKALGIPAEEAMEDVKLKVARNKEAVHGGD